MAGGLNKRTIAYLCALGALAAYYMVWPVWRAQYPLEIWFTESWNAYHQDAAAVSPRRAVLEVMPVPEGEGKGSRRRDVERR